MLEESKETPQEFYNRFNKENPHPEFLQKSFKNPSFQLRLTHEGGVKIKTSYECEHNRCERNTFNVLKKLIKDGSNRYFPVSGWAFLKSTSFFEHFWIYDKLEDVFVDVTPMTGGYPYAYGGVINFDINQEIMDAEVFSDVKFLLGKHGTSLYHKFEDQECNPKFHTRKQMDMIDFIHNEPNYKELSDFTQKQGITTFDELIGKVPKLYEILEKVRNNREFDAIYKLLDQIKELQVSH
jgi:hypothetical protein